MQSKKSIGLYNYDIIRRTGTGLWIKDKNLEKNILDFPGLPCVIDLPSEIHHAAISKSGRYLIVLDKNGVMHCMNGKTGEHIWQKPWYYTPNLQIFEDKKTVLVFSWHSVEMLSLENGEIVWEFEGDDSIYEFYNNDDELILVGPEEIFHIDIETGEKATNHFESSLLKELINNK